MRNALRSINPDPQPPLQALDDVDLVACIFGRGRPSAAARDLARHALAQCGGLANLTTASPGVLGHLGLTPTQAAAFLAACELTCRLARGKIDPRAPLSNTGAVAYYLSRRYGRNDQEVMGALFLDRRHQLIAEQVPFRGTISRAAVEPRQILKEGIVCGAAGLILFHNHPSGDPTPSTEDILFSRRMDDAAQVLGIDLLDHLIVSHHGNWRSLRNTW